MRAMYFIDETRNFFDSKIEYITNTLKKPTLKWNIFFIILRIILASNKASKTLRENRKKILLLL